MARYIAEIEGNRGPASRLGTPESGIYGHIRGWDAGVSVNIRPDYDNPDKDVVTISATGGSNNGHGVTIGTIRWNKAKQAYICDTYGKPVKAGG